MAERRTSSRRQPVSCEPCRVRKIRCFRDGPPCSTCIRRGVSHCAYSNSRRLESGSAFRHARATPAVYLSPPATAHAQDTTADLARRVHRLERILQDQDEAVHDPLNDATNTDGRCTQRPLVSERSPQRRIVGGVLRRTEGGHVRFVPKSRQWSHDPDQGDCASGFSSGSPLSSHRKPVKTLLAGLPPVSQCSELVNVYFRSFASLFHILHDPTFMSQYESFLEDAENVSLSWLALLFAILGTAALALERDSPILCDLSRSGKVADLSENYRRAAMACLEADEYLCNHNVATLQALILLIYSICHSHGRTWTLLGLTHHLAISLGCHIDPSEFGLSPVESEERRRCWSGLMMLYTSENLSMGNSGLPHHTLPANCHPPADIDDHDIGIEMQRPVAPAQATQMTYILLKFRLYDICAKLCEQVLDIEGSPSPEVVKELDVAINNEKNAWSVRYLDGTTSSASKLPVHHKAHLRILQSYASHLILILHQAAEATREDIGVSESNWSEVRIVTSALQLLEIHSEFEDCHDLAPFRWYNRGLGSFHAFHAATVLFSLRWSTYGRQRADEIYESLQSCAVRFENLNTRAASELSPHFSKATPVLRCLCSRVAAELSHAKETQHVASEATPSSINNSSGASLLVAEPLPVVFQNSCDLIDGASTDDQDLDSLLQQFQPQHWLTPSSLPWDQWDSWLF